LHFGNGTIHGLLKSETNISKQQKDKTGRHILIFIHKASSTEQ